MNLDTWSVRFPYLALRCGLSILFLSATISLPSGAQGQTPALTPQGQTRALIHNEQPAIREALSEAGIPWPAGEPPILPDNLIPPFES